MTATPTIRLRPGTGEDEDVLRAVCGDARGSEFDGLPDQLRDQILDLQFRAQRSDYLARYPDSTDELILIDDEPAGRCWTADRDGTLRILDIAVLRRLRRRGIASSVLRTLQQRAALTGRRLELSVRADNEAALSLYRGLGFAPLHGNTAAADRIELGWTPGGAAA
jgi:ribosomal protein S18 acetylase RimI-like enzyme